jgi:hypothetical protein
MAVIWYQKDNAWHTHPLDPDEPAGFWIEDGVFTRVNYKQAWLLVAPRTRLHQTEYVLLGWPRRVCINGRPFWGMHVLRDQDEILLPRGQLLFFSAQDPPQVVHQLPPGLKATCPICGDPVTAPAVRCPQCGIYHHERPDRPCWSSGATCSTYQCGQPTRPSRTWTPLELEMGEAYGTLVATEAVELVS